LIYNLDYKSKLLINIILKSTSLKSIKSLISKLELEVKKGPILSKKVKKSEIIILSNNELSIVIARFSKRLSRAKSKKKEVLKITRNIDSKIRLKLE
jgi:hypothetical protein